MSTPSIGSFIPALAFLDPLLQDNTLMRVFQDALFPKLIYRMEAWPEKWDAGQGERKIFTRSSLLSATPDALDPDTDPVPVNEEYEQWEVLCNQYSKTTDVNTAVSRTTLANLFLRKGKTLGLNAGQTINRLARNKLFCAYTGGHTVTDNAGAPSTSVTVASLNGFTQVVVDGQLVGVSTANPLAITIGGTAASVTGATPTDSAQPLGPGTLTLAAGITFAAGDAVVASNAATIIRSGGGTSVDALSATDRLTLADIRRAIAILRANSVPPHDDGKYHVHLDPIAEDQLFSDPEVQNLNEGRFDGAMYQDFVVGHLVRAYFYGNEESPGAINGANSSNVGTLIQSRPANAASAMLGPEIWAEVMNSAGVPVVRTIVTGGGALYENYVDESEFLTEAGVQGKIGEFSIINNGVQVSTDRIRYIIRAPQDRLQQQVAQTWSWMGDFGVPSDQLGGRTSSRFKRAVVIESGVSV